MFVALRVVVVDDHPLMVKAIRLALEEADDITIVGEARSGSQALPIVARTVPDVVLLDLMMPEMDGLTCLKLLRTRYPQVKVVMLSATEDRGLIDRVLASGATVFISKSVEPRDLAALLRGMAGGAVYHTMALPDDRDTRLAREAGLSEREFNILRALAKGLSNEQIAKEIWLSRSTVKFHLRNIYRKLGVSNRTEATRYAYQRGYVDAAPVID
jgi:two-component system, NarL family, response regulator LiaR